jgi:hypothetical protein
MTPSRATGSVLADTRNPTVPSPCPLDPEVMAIQPVCDAAFHGQSRSTVIETVPAPPVAPNFGADEDTLA